MPRRTGLLDLYFMGGLAGLLYSVAYYYSEKFDPKIELSIWILATLWSLMILKRGLDYRRITYSFSQSFIAIVSFIYIFFILVLRISGVPRAFALLLFPVLVIAVIGYFKEKIEGLINYYRSGKRLGFKVSLTRRVRTTIYRLDPIMWVFIAIGLAILIVFLITPVLMMLYHAFEVPPGKPIYDNFVRIFTARKYVRLRLYRTEKPFYFRELADGRNVLVITGLNYGVLLNSLINATLVTSIATLLGILVAFVMARYSFPGRTFIRLLAIVPLFVTPFVNAYVVKILFSENGPISMITEALFGWAIRIDSLAGVALAQIMAFYPIVYLNAYSSFINVDPSMEEQAENLGAKGFKLFSSVTLPLALPGIVAGSILVFIFSLEDLGAPIIFQEKNLMSYQIYSSFVSETGIVSPEIAALGFVMLFLAAMGFIAIRSYVSMRSYAMISRGGRWTLRERRLGPLGLALIYLFLLPLIVFTAMPQIGVILLAFNIIPPYGFKLQLDKATTEYFVDLFQRPDYFIYIRNTLTYALMAVALATTIAIMIAYSVSRTKIKVLTPLMDTLATIPLAIPGLVIALGYYYFYSTFFSGTPLDPTSGPGVFQAWIVLVIAYSIRKLPFVVRSVYAGFQQVHEALEEAALNLGASRSRVIFGVILPFILTYVISGAVIGFIYITTEVSTSITIGALRVDQAPMTFYMKNVYQGGTVTGVQVVASMGVLLILFQLLAIFLIVVVFKQRYAFIGV